MYPPASPNSTILVALCIVDRLSADAAKNLLDSPFGGPSRKSETAEEMKDIRLSSPGARRRSVRFVVERRPLMRRGSVSTTTARDIRHP